MSLSLLDDFAATIREVRADRGVRAVVITGKGTCFSAGADLRGVVQREDPDHPRQAHEQSYAMYEPFMSVMDVEVPVIAAMNGHAVGGGFGLSLMCDLRLANRESKYGANFARLGFHSGLGISYLLPRLVGVARAAELLFTGRLILGTEAAHIGLVNAAVPGADVLPRSMELADRIASAAPYAVRMMKKSFYRGLGWDVPSAAYLEAYAQAASLSTQDAQEGMAALLEKRDPVFGGR
jgi:enoyl-CoA hydratase/carnithine racemase